MNKKIIYQGGIIILFLIILFFGIITLTIFFLKHSSKAEVCLKKFCFKVKIAQSSLQREKGLMYRKSLPKNEGMLFIFPKEDYHSFWMKNTFISLDIIWLDKNGEVVFISKNNKPCLNESCPIIKPTAKAKYVLEINSGLVDQLNLRVGEKAQINYLTF